MKKKLLTGILSLSCTVTLIPESIAEESFKLKDFNATKSAIILNFEGLKKGRYIDAKTVRDNIKIEKYSGSEEEIISDYEVIVQETEYEGTKGAANKTNSVIIKPEDGISQSSRYKVTVKENIADNTGKKILCEDSTGWFGVEVIFGDDFNAEFDEEGEPVYPYSWANDTTKFLKSDYYNASLWGERINIADTVKGSEPENYSVMQFTAEESSFSLNENAWSSAERPTDYTVECKYKYPSYANSGSFVTALRATGTENGYTYNSGYRVILRDGKANDSERSSVIKLYKGYLELNTTLEEYTPESSLIDVRMSVQGNNIQYFIDDNKIFDFDDDEMRTMTAGTVAFSDKNSAKWDWQPSYIDDLYVTRVVKYSEKAENISKVTITDIEILENDTLISGDVTLYNSSYEGNDGTLLFGIYDVYGKLLNIFSKSVTLPEKMQSDTYCFETDPCENASYIKAFLWDSAELLTPIGFAKKLPESESEAITFYVSKTGSDGNDGSFEKPFASINGAKNAIRALKRERAKRGESQLPKGGVCVYIRAGTYITNSSFVFNEEDSGTKDAPITYRAYNGEKVTFVGGIELDANKFLKTENRDILDRIYNSDARENIYEYNLSDVENFRYGSIYDSENTKARPNELVVDGELMNIARYPDVDIEGDDIYEKPSTIEKSTEEDSLKVLFSIEDYERVNNWKTAEDAVITANWRVLWSSEYYRIADITDGVVTTKEDYSDEIDESIARFYIVNLLEELDSPGEFYIDKENNKLYYYPSESFSKSSDVWLSTLSSDMFYVKGADYLTFRDFEIPCSIGRAFNITGDNNLIYNCNVKNLQKNAISMNGDKNGAVGNIIFKTDGGIGISGGDRNTLTPGESFAVNNEIEKFSRITKTYCAAIQIGGCGNSASFNEIHDGPHSGILFTGNENVISYNNIYDLVNQTHDAGGIYAGRSWVWRGNRIEHNYFHDFDFYGGYGTSCIYFDDYLSGNSITKNIFHNINARAVWVEAGSDNNIENNIIINGVVPIKYADRGKKETLMKDMAEDNTMRTSLAAVPYNSDIWLEKYPILSDIMNEQVYIPKRVVIKNNVTVNCWKNSLGDLYEGMEEEQEITDNIVNISDPGFVDLANGNLSLKEDAEIYRLLPEFEDTEFEKMGRFNERFGEMVSNVTILGVNCAGILNNGRFTVFNEENFDVTPIKRKGEIFVPADAVLEMLGEDAEINVGSDKIKTDGTEKEMSEKAFIYENTLYIPLDTIQNVFDKNVYLNDKGLIVISGSSADIENAENEYLQGEALRQINLR